MKTPKPMSLTLRVLARLLSYPDAELRAHLDELRQALRQEAALTTARAAEIDALIEAIAAQSDIDAEADYVQLFDSGRRTSLHLFEHVHGDSRERGPALIDLLQTYEQAGLHFEAPELPDHLGVVLEFASTQPPAVAREFLGEVAHILNALFTALANRGNPYACVIAAVLEVAGQRVQAVAITPEPGLDDTWAEPEAFDGCATKGQNRPGQAQPLHFVPASHKTTRASSSSQGVSP